MISFDILCYAEDGSKSITDRLRALFYAYTIPHEYSR